MRKIFRPLMSVVAVVGTLACTTDATEDLGVKVGGKTQLTLSLDNTRTQLGEKNGDTYPLTWSENDQISVNGETSDKLAVADGAGTSSAVFTFGGELKTPYFIAYPAAAEGQVQFSAMQLHTSNTSFGNNAAVMYGYSANGENIKLNHLTGILKISIVCADDEVDLNETTKLQCVRISTIDRKPIAGAFNIDFTTGKLTATKESTDVITYLFDKEPLFPGRSVNVHVAVPAGVYDELYVTVEDTEGNVMQKTVKAYYNSEDDDKSLKVGTVREFSELPFVADDTTNTFVIKDYDSLLAFANAAKAGTADAPVTKNAVFVADVEIPESGWTTINAQYYTGTINGNGYAIKGLKTPLFSILGANIKALHFEGVAMTDATTTDYRIGALAGTWYGTSCTNCSVEGSIELARSAKTGVIRISGLFGYAYNSTADWSISDCVNNCSITATLSDSGSTTIIGGVVGDIYFEKAAKNFTFTNLTNNAAITIKGNPGSAVYVGGIWGRHHYIVGSATNCHNNGDISVVCGTSNFMNIGGIAGRYAMGTSWEDTGNFTATDCSNSGNITATYTGENQTSEYAALAGCFGILNHQAKANIELTNCDNSGNVELKGTTVNNQWHIAGIAGCLYGRVQVTDCDNTCEYIKCEVDTANHYLMVGGHVGRGGIRASNGKNSSDNTMKFTNCDNSADISVKVNTIANNRIFVAGSLAMTYPYSSTTGWHSFNDVNNNGSITLDVADWKSTLTTFTSAVGGILGSNWLTNNDGTPAWARTDTSKFISCGNGAAGITEAITIKGAKSQLTVVGGIVGFNVYPGTIDDCTNNMTIEHNATEVVSTCYIGGLCGQTSSMANKDTIIKNSTNNGAVKVGTTTAATLSVSGLVGAAVSHGLNHATYLNLNNVVNNGAVTVGGTANLACDALYVGSVIGQMSSYDGDKYTFASVLNKGNVTVSKTTATTSNIGGVVGNLTYALANIQSYNTVTVDEGVAAGMLAGVASTTLAVTDCAVGGKFVEGTTETDIEAGNLASYLFTDRSLTSFDGVSLYINTPAEE